MSSEDINACFRVPNTGARLVNRAYFRNDPFWEDITSGGKSYDLPEVSTCFQSGRHKSNQVVNPVLRMVLKIISHSILSRKENTAIRDEDLFILHAMLTRKNVDFCHLFLGQLSRQIHAGVGKVTIGGMLTPIAKRLIAQPLTIPHLDDHYFLDFEKLRDIRFLVSKKPPFRYLLGKDVEFLLPNATLVEVNHEQDWENMKMNSSKHEYVIERKIINYGEANEQVLGDASEEDEEEDEEEEDEEEEDQEDEESQTTNSRVEESRFERLETRMNSMERDFSSFQSTMDRRFDTMSSDVERNFTSLGAQVNDIATLLKNMGASQENWRHEGPRPPPS